MSAKRFCDACGTEVIRPGHQVRRTLDKVYVEVQVSFAGKFNADVCDACVLKAINEGKPFRPEDNPVRRGR